MFSIVLYERSPMSSINAYDGFTGLEAAIVLIAFVVVAAVFSYMVIGAGFFTKQKAEEAVHTGVQQASSTLEVVGNVYGKTSAAATAVDYIQFSIALAPGGTPVDFAKVVLTYSDTTHLEQLQQMQSTTYPVTSPITAGYWAVTDVQNEPSPSPGKLLSPGEQFVIRAHITNAIGVNQKFTIEIKPSVGAAFGITRTTPGGLNTVNILY